MQKYSNAFVNSLGRPVEGGKVTVTNSPGGTLATLFSDNGVTSAANPVVTDKNGLFQFYAPDGRYSLSLISANTTAVSIDDCVLLEDPIDGSNSVTPQQFMTAAQLADVAAGNLTVGVSSAFAKALATGRNLYVPGGANKYLIDSTVIVPTGARIRSDRALLKLAAGVNNHVFRVANGADDWLIEGLLIDGSKESNAGGNAISTGGTGATNGRILRNYIFNASANGIYVGGSTLSSIKADLNFVTGCGLAGISGDDLLNHFSMNDNHAWLNGTHGVGIIGVAKNGTISNNVAWDNGQGTQIADNITAYNSANDNIAVVGNATRGGLNNGIHMGGQRIVMAGNTAYGAAFYGIVLRSHDGTACNDCAVTGNVSYLNGVSGFWFDTCVNLAASGNSSRKNTAHGYAFDSCSHVSVSGCTSYANTLAGYKNGVASTFVSFSGCTGDQNGTDGLDMTNMADCQVTGGSYSQNAAWGINRSGTDARNIIDGGVRARANGQAQQIATPPLSSKVGSVQTNTSTQIQAATNITLPPYGDYFYVLGTVGISNIDSSWAGRRISLQFDDVLTVTEANNLRMAGNLTTRFTTSISFISDGGNWIETSRSMN